MTRICTQSVQSGSITGQNCSACGHTNSVHPGAHNPSITECFLCVLYSVRQTDWFPKPAVSAALLHSFVLACAIEENIQPLVDYLREHGVEVTE